MKINLREHVFANLDFLQKMGVGVIHNYINIFNLSHRPVICTAMFFFAKITKIAQATIIAYQYDCKICNMHTLPPPHLFQHTPPHPHPAHTYFSTHHHHQQMDMFAHTTVLLKPCYFLYTPPPLKKHQVLFQNKRTLWEELIPSIYDLIGNSECIY